MTEAIEILKKDAISLLGELIAVPSFSKEEWQTASILSRFLAQKKVATTRVGNNVFCTNLNFNASKKTILLNSHHDTVQPNSAYTKDPFKPVIEDSKLYGLGSNDAGGALVSMTAAFLYFYNHTDLKYNIALSLTGEEEISGANGIESILSYLPAIDCAIVGEPTGMQLAVAERGLLVLDCKASGKAGHAARNEGENAIYKALKDIRWFQEFSFYKISTLLGSINMSVTVIKTENKAHNVVPAECRFVVDVRLNEMYEADEVLNVIRKNILSDVVTRSTRLRSTIIPLDHPLVQAGIALGKNHYGSPTTSDKALMPFPALKIGPGDSSRSHSADEFIFIREIEEGIDTYIQLLKQLL